jgi:undecaprenyl-diphosphatase
MLEASIILRIQSWFTSSIAKGFSIFSARWAIYLFIPFVILLRFFPKTRDIFLPTCWAALLAFTASTVLAQTIGRVRPYLAGIGVHALVPPNLQTGSFPSSHTAVAAAIAAMITTAHPVAGLIACVLAVIVAFGRVAAGMHYPSDILGGAAVGLFSALIVRVVQEALAK